MFLESRTIVSAVAAFLNAIEFSSVTGVSNVPGVPAVFGFATLLAAVSGDLTAADVLLLQYCSIKNKQNLD